ncbi:hypothetical protein [Cylindrospermum stagnale]|uniref:hypothetical protein n=1 Tax=Cylindrospermum stagnale TaxID=142864 RepID=UPI00059DF9C8|nr:hypothetical protein [Cylindrospermum stagnale]
MSKHKVTWTWVRRNSLPQLEECDGETPTVGDGAYVAKACCIQQAFIVPKARCNHPFRMVGQQHPHSDRIAKEHSKAVNLEPTAEPGSEDEIWKQHDMEMDEYLNPQAVLST